MLNTRRNPSHAKKNFLTDAMIPIGKGFGEIIRAGFNELVKVFKPDDPPPRPEIPLKSRRLDSIIGASLGILLVFVFFALDKYQDPHVRNTAIEALGGPWLAFIIVMVLLVCCLWVAALWGEHCVDRVRYKIFLSSLFLTLIVFSFIIILLRFVGQLWP